jgi:2-polyprenyl-3-methyl-5-hydroxy-6-metoxy-1,4-benzoquinol methylase
MTVRDRLRWDTYYQKTPEGEFPHPDPVLFQFTPSVLHLNTEREFRALDLASGLGQNGLWLATQGYTTDLLDISREALKRAQEQATLQQIRNLNFLQVDLDEVALQSEAYDLVCVFRYLKRDLFPRIRACVRPNGRVIYQTFNVNYLRRAPDFNPEFLLQPGELASYFEDWRILLNNEVDHISQIVALKPE